MKNNQTNKLVPLVISDNEIEANLLKGILESNNIKAYVFTGYSENVFPMPYSVDGIKLMVNETDYNEAVKILKAHNPNIDFVIQNE